MRLSTSLEILNLSLRTSYLILHVEATSKNEWLARVIYEERSNKYTRRFFFFIFLFFSFLPRIISWVYFRRNYPSNGEPRAELWKRKLIEQSYRIDERFRLHLFVESAELEGPKPISRIMSVLPLPDRTDRLSSSIIGIVSNPMSHERHLPWPSKIEVAHWTVLRRIRPSSRDDALSYDLSRSGTILR